MNKVDLAISVVETALKSKTIGKYLCGQYTDGKIRSIPDAIHGETKSPKQKKKEEKEKRDYEEWKSGGKKKKKKKKKHKKKKGVKKYPNYMYIEL